MNNKIKEMLDNMKEISSFEYTTDWFELNYEDTKILLDYITNLQNQLEEKTYLYNKLDTESKYVITNLQKEYEDLKELENDYRVELKLTARYEKRINKAIGYIEECTSSPDKYERFISTGESKKLLNILKGEEDE